MSDKIVELEKLVEDLIAEYGSQRPPTRIKEIVQRIEYWMLMNKGE